LGFIAVKMKIVKKLLLSFALMIFLFTTASSQDSTGSAETSARKGFDRSRLFIGGNFGLSFGTYTLVNISPQVGYRFNNYLAAGIGINGQYTRIKDRYAGYTATTSYGVAGMNLFGRVYPIQQFFAQLQPEMNYIWGKYKSGNSEYSLNGKILPSLLVGAGGMIPMGRAGGLIIMAQYDLLNKSNSTTQPGTPYGKNIFFSVGFNVGL
jgi:hypothetical protein